MRRVPSEMNDRGERGRLGRRGEVASKQQARTRRRMLVEGLERRELMAVIPTPIVSTTGTLAGSSTTVNLSAPSVTVNPLNANQLVSVYTSYDTSQPAGQQIRIAGRYSLDGGASWNALAIPGNQTDPYTVRANAPAQFSRADQAFASFDNANNLYVGVLQHNDQNNAGMVRVTHYNAALGAPVQVATTTAHTWDQGVSGQERDPAVTGFHLIADDNLANFTDPVSGNPRTDASAGNVYVALALNVPPPTSPVNYSPYSLVMRASSDQAATWGAYLGIDGGLTGTSQPSQAVRPRMAVSQGAGASTAGRVTLIWDDVNRGRQDSPYPTDVIRSQSVSATGSTLAAAGGTVEVARTRVLGALTSTYGRTTAQSALGVGPTPEIASDNSISKTLGVAGASAGRIYVAYTDWDPSFSSNPAENTDVRLRWSDNGGASWTGGNTKVNDDSAFLDGKSGAVTSGQVQGPPKLADNPSGRTQFMPSVAVDRANGTVFLSFYDARDDASNTRVATYLAASIDGGSTFAPQTYANAPFTVKDAITGLSSNEGPLPDNQSASSIRETVFGYGDHQGLAVLNGVAHPVWSGNQNGGHEGENRLSVLTASAGFAAGPRVLSTTTGPIQSTTVGNTTFNNTTTADGRPILDGFVVDFDRPLDIATFTAADVQVVYRDVLTPASGAGTTVGVASITRVTGVAATRFAYFVRLNAGAVAAIYATQAGGIGTYSFKIGPNVADIAGNLMDQNGNGTTGEATDVYTNPTTLASGLTDTTLLPLIVPGPRVISTQVPGSPASADNLVADGKVSQLDVTFDRDMIGASFTPDDIVSILGPAGKVLVPYTQAAVGTNANRVIPDDASKPLVSTIAVLPNSNSFPIKKLTIKLDITHKTDSQLKIQLMSPLGTTITLLDGVGGSGANFTGTTFDDSSVVPIASGSAPFSGVYAPAQALSAFIGEQLQGNWKLIVTDKSNNPVDPGVLNGWSLTADPAATVNQISARVFRVGFPEQVLRGTYTISLGPDIRSTAGYTGTAPSEVGAKMDQNRNAGLDLLFGRNPVGVNVIPQTFTNGVAKAITDKPAASAAVPTTSTITVPASSSPIFIGDLDVQVRITHARVSDLKLELIGPDGTVVVLADGVGGNGANFTNTGFDDQATTSITSVTAADAPFSAPYRPAQALNAFNGRQLAGTWTLRVTDKVNGTTGTLNSWSFTATSGPNVNYATSAVPVTIPANGSIATPTIAKAVLVVPESFTIQALSLNMSLTYPNDPDIRGDLLVYPLGVDVNNPASTPTFTINLFNQDGNVGPTGTRQNFVNTVFDDTAATLIQNGGPPFNGRFKPRQPLSLLIGQNAGNYQFVLQVTNYAATAGTIDKFGLTLTKAVPTTGLGETVADRASVDFRIFTMDPTQPLSSSEWSPVGPASYSGGKLAGRMSATVLDPADPSGNTVYVGAGSGGVWKTTNFLTNDAEGPTYIPLTDFGPTSSLRIGSLATFGRNGDTAQTVILAGTGEPATLYNNVLGGLDTSQGVGFILSYDGGVSWTLLDSAVNVDASGKALPIAQRNHDFVGMTINKVLIDPRYSITGDLVMYAAISDPKGLGKVSPGIWRSIDSGRTWQLKRAGNATDITFDLNSATIDTVANPAGNVRTLFAAFGSGGAAGQGVYITPNQGDTFTLLAGNVVQQTIRDDNTQAAIPVLNLPAPSGQRIVLAKPFLTGNVNLDVQYQSWIYALGADGLGRMSGLWLTKDLGQSWTRLDLSSVDPNYPVPSNNLGLGDYDVTGNPTYNLALFNLSLAIDPNDPNITYLGGTAHGTGHLSALIRVDATYVSDAHAFFAANDRADGGLRQAYAVDAATVTRRNSSAPGPSPVSIGSSDTAPHRNLVRDPNSPFNANSTIYVNNITNFSNSGSGVYWTKFETVLDGSEGVQQILTYKDPLTGKARLVIADSQGMFTGVDNNGKLLTSTGTVTLPTGSRNGNLQTTQFYYGASQPSSIGAQAAAALFYGMAQENGFPESDPNIITPGAAGYGNLQWNGGYIAYGTGVATDQGGSGTVYQYKWPQQINDQPPNAWSPSDFFKVNPDGGAEVSRTFNLYSGGGVNQWPGFDSSGQPLVGNFVVNPLTKNQIIMGSGAGYLFGTENEGVIWNIIAAPGDLDGTYVKAPAFGAPDPNGPGVPGALNNYILAGTQGGHIYVTLTGGGAGGASNVWYDISGGLANRDPIQAIVTNPNRGSHEAYAISSSRVYRNTDTSLKNGSGVVVGAGWVDITGDLFAQTHTSFGDKNLVETLIRSGSLTSIAADWRYVIPDTAPTPGNPNPPTHPMLYVSGNGGVLRSDNAIGGGANWKVFPDLTLNAPQENGGLPSVMVTDLDLALGNVNPTTGRPDVSTGPNVLLASTYGRGAYAIKLAPIVFKSTVSLDPASDSGRPTVTVPSGGTDSRHPGDLTDLYTNVLTPTFQGLSEQSAFGGVVAITLYDATDPLNVVPIGGYDPSSGPIDPTKSYVTDTFGRFSVAVNAGIWTKGVSDGTKVIRVQATDQAGTRGNLADFTFTLDTTEPATPTAPTLSAASDSGFFNNDNYTNVVKPFIVMTPTEGNVTVYLLRKPAGAPNSSYQIVNTFDVPTLLNGASPTPITVQDTGVPGDGNYVYAVREIDPAGNLGAISADSAVITIDTLKPSAPGQPVLIPVVGNDSGKLGDNVTNVTSPIFSISSGEPATTKVTLKRNGVKAPSGNPANPNQAGGNIQDAGPLADGTYSYTAFQEDLAGNVGVDSAATSIRILTKAPLPIPTIALFPDDDSGTRGDNATKVTQPRLYGTGPLTPPEGYTLKLVLYPAINSPQNAGVVVLSTAMPNTGTYQVQYPTALSKGTYYLATRIYDVADNFSESARLALTINDVAPTDPTSLRIDPRDDSGIKGDGKTVSRQPRLIGNTTPGALVEIYNANDPQKTVLATTFALSAPDNAGNPAGFYSTQLPFDLTNGKITLSARSRDNVGNVNPSIGSLVLTAYSVQSDYDNDGRADVGIYSPPTGWWYIRNTNRNDPNYTGPIKTSQMFGIPNQHIPMPADYLGNGRTQIAAYDPTNATWAINRGPGQPAIITTFGRPGLDTPLPADYDGDGKADIAVFRPSTAQWFVQGSGSTVPTIVFGTPNVDKPVPADYSGLGRDQLAVYNPSTFVWKIRDSLTGATSTYQFGQSGDIPQPGDYDGLGRAEMAVYRPSTGQFIVYNWDTNVTSRITVGAAGDVPVARDYDGDGKFDAAVFRPSTGTWRILTTSTNQLNQINWGAPGIDMALNGPLAYRVAAVNPSVGVPAASSAVHTVGTAAPKKAAVKVVGAAAPKPKATNVKKPLTRVNTVKLDGSVKTPVRKAAAKAAAKPHVLGHYDNLLEQLSHEGLGSKNKPRG